MRTTHKTLPIRRADLVGADVLLDGEAATLLDGEADEARRASKRHPVVRIVEYSPYPRRRSDEERQVGFTSNESDGGICLMAPASQPLGRTLRLSVREVDGRTRVEAIARVVWCRDGVGDRYAMGLEFLETQRPTESDPNRSGQDQHGARQPL